MRSKTKKINEAEDAQRKILALLAPCFEDPPGAAAVILINSDKGTAFFNLNMDMLELLTTLMNTSTHLQQEMCPHEAPSTLQ